jgi:hypothetical protein
MLPQDQIYESFAILIRTLEYSVGNHERKIPKYQNCLNSKMNQNFSELRVIGKK